MNRPKINFKFTGGIDGGRGWKGDIKPCNYQLKNSSKQAGNPGLTAGNPWNLPPMNCITHRR
jgi:hypothetical protein